MPAGLPAREEAEALLREAESLNPGPWGDHSRVAALCAERIARACGLDPEKAYIQGLLHDIGRRYGVTYLRHVYDGWKYMRQLGYEEAARICLTHSFNLQKLEDYVGSFDLTPEQQQELEAALLACQYDDYDRLIQLCDALAGADGVMQIEERMADVKRRYGSYPQDKWDQNLALRRRFEQMAGRDLYEIVGEVKARQPEGQGMGSLEK